MRRKSKKTPTNNLLSHLRELFLRTLFCTICLIISGIAVFFFYEPLLKLLSSPLGSPLYYTNPAGSLTLVMRICFIGALTISIPVIVYNLIMFIRPAFSNSLSFKRVYFTAGLSSLLAIYGAFFAYLCIIPGTLEFFSGFKVSGLSAIISADSYLDFVINIIIAFIIIFQLLLIIMLADTVNKIPPKKLIGNEKWIILASIVIAIITPFNYDLVTSLFVIVPIVALYNLSIIFIVIRRISQRQRAKKLRKVSKTTLKIQELEITPAITSVLTLTNSLDQMTSPVIKAKRKVTRNKIAMDIIPNKKQVKKPLRHAYSREKPVVYTAGKVRYFSDISLKPHVNRVSASQ